MTHSSASASEMMASSAAPAPSSVYPTISFRRRSPLECPPPAVDVSSVSEQSERTLTALDAISLPHQASPCPTYTLMTPNALLIFTAVTHAPPCVTPQCSSPFITLTSRLTLPSLTPKRRSLPPSPVIPPGLTPPARNSLSVSSVDGTSWSVAALPPDRPGPSLTILSPIGSLTLTARVIATILLILMTLTTTTSRTTGEPHPPVCASDGELR